MITLTNHKNQSEMETSQNLNQDDRFLHELKEIVLRNLENESFSVEQLATEYGMSRSQLHRKLKKLRNQSISRFIREIRLDKSLAMLENNEGTVSEIAYRVGFSSPTYFNTCFRDYFGFPPGEAKIRGIHEGELDNHHISIESDLQVKSKKMYWYGLIGILLVLCIGMYFGSQNWGSNNIGFDNPGFSNQQASIAVLPFRNLSVEDQDNHYSNGIMQNIIDNLSKIPEFVVLPSRTTNLYGETKLLPTELGEELKVNYILDGTFQKVDSLIQVSLALTRTSDGRQIWTSNNSTFSLPELFDMQAQIAKEVASQLQMTLNSDLNEAFESTPTNSELAYDYYLRGKEKIRSINYHTQANDSNAAALNEAKLLFNLAIEQDSGFASAYLGLARTYFTDNEDFFIKFVKDTTQYDQFIELVEQAIDLNPRNSEGYFLKGVYEIHAIDQPESAEASLLQALDLNPNNLEALHTLADFYLFQKYNIVEAVRLLKEIESRTIAKDELYPVYKQLSQAYSKVLDFRMEQYYLDKCLSINDSVKDLEIPWFYLRSGNSQKALEHVKRIYPVTDNQFSLLIHANFRSYNGMFEEALPYYERWAKLVDIQGPDNWFSTMDYHRYGQALINTGRDSLGTIFIEKQLRDFRNNYYQNEFDGSYDLAGIYSFLGDLDSAYYYFDKHLKAKGFLRAWGHPSFVLADYQFENLRTDSRFIERFEAEKETMRELRDQMYAVDASARHLE